MSTVNSSVTVSGYTIKYAADSNGYTTITVLSNSTSIIVAITQGADVNTVISTAVNQIQRDVKTGRVTSVDADTLTSYLNSSGVTDLNNLVSQAAPTAPPPTPPSPTTPATTPTTTPPPPPPPPSSTNTLTGPANSDSGAIQKSSVGTTPISPAAAAGAGGTTLATATNGSTTASSPSKSTTIQLPTIPNYTFQASSASQQPIASVSTPGRRMKNPLGELETYTYQVSLYMVTPDAYAAFVSSGRNKIDVLNPKVTTSVSGSTPPSGGGAFLVAQSGGINNTNNKRADGFNFDYGIDNLRIKSVINTRTTGSPNVSNYEFSFDVIEPYGFSFISNLKRANQQVAAYSGGTLKTPQNPTDQFFILGIRFFGYGTNGVPAKSTDTMSYDGTSKIIGAIDPISNSSDTLFESFYDIKITSLAFKLDGKATTYQIKASNVGTQGIYSMKRGLVNDNTTVVAGNVAEAIDKLMVQLNTVQQQRKDNQHIGHPNKYSVVWAPGTQKIIDASLISPTDLQKFKWSGSGALTKEQVNAALEVKQQQAPHISLNVTNRQQTPILEAINNIIKQSTFLEDALKVVYTTALESPENQNAPPQVSNTQQTKVSWYSCTGIVKSMVWDPVVHDWAYDMVFYIQSYQTPVVDSAYVKSGLYYPGPHKRYDYWYTGKNTELIKYEQTFNNLYFQIAYDPSQGSVTSSGGNNPAGSEQGNTSAGQGNASSSPADVPKVPGLKTNQDALGRTGDALEAQNNYITSLFDPHAQAHTRIEILGDPDYLFQEPSYSENVLYDPIYGQGGFNINPTGGQVFIEIDFKEAVDYDNQTGTLSINDSIQFWQYPKNIKIQGISYMLVDVESRFSTGAFTQSLGCIINTLYDPILPTTDEARPNPEPANNTEPKGTPPKAATQSASSTGTRPDPKFNANQSTPTATKTNNKTPAQPVTAKGVANDDGDGTIIYGYLGG